MLTQRVLLTKPLRTLLSEGFARRQATPSKPGVGRIAEAARVPKWLLGAVCGVRGYEKIGLDYTVELTQFHRILEELYRD